MNWYPWRHPKQWDTGDQALAVAIISSLLMALCNIWNYYQPNWFIMNLSQFWQNLAILTVAIATAVTLRNLLK